MTKAPSSAISRRGFLGNMLLAGAASAFVPTLGFLTQREWIATAHAATPDLLHDTFNGLLAFVVPGSDPYSIAQGVSTVDPGGVDANVTDLLIGALDESTPFIPGFSAMVATVLNQFALAVNPAAGGAFASPFSRLAFAEKVVVFQLMDATESLQLLAGLLPLFVAFLAYSEVGAFDPATRQLTAQPLGWTMSNYRGVSDGRDELLGYFRR